MKFHGFLAATLCVLGFSGAANAFDTGHHADLTREAMAEFGLSNDAISVAQAENWLVDYFSNQPATGLRGELAELHFDNLTTTAEVQNYWGRLTINTEQAVRGAAQANDPLKVVALMGMSLHAVQDFYTHSNWVETQRPVVNPANYLTSTWFAVAPAPAGLRTGTYPAVNPNAIAATDHGNYTAGMNHDSYVRPRWDEAYVYAWNASRQWVGAIQSWVMAVNPAVWPQVRALALTAGQRVALQGDLEAAHRISEWVATPGNDGHWKGSGSGVGASFSTFTIGWTAKSDSIFVRHFKTDHWYQELTNNLNTMPPPVALPAVPPVPPMNKRAVRVQTVSVEELPVGRLELRINSPHSPNYYARVTVAGQTFLETMQYRRSNIPAAARPLWHTIKFVDIVAPNAAIRYELLSEGVRNNYLADINPAGPQRLDFTLTMGPAAGAVAGDIAGNAGAVLTSSGAGQYRARVQLRVDSMPLL